MYLSKIRMWIKLPVLRVFLEEKDDLGKELCNLQFIVYKTKIFECINSKALFHSKYLSPKVCDLSVSLGIFL